MGTRQGPLPKGRRTLGESRLASRAVARSETYDGRTATCPVRSGTRLTYGANESHRISQPNSRGRTDQDTGDRAGGAAVRGSNPFESTQDTLAGLRDWIRSDACAHRALRSLLPAGPFKLMLANDHPPSIVAAMFRSLSGAVASCAVPAFFIIGNRSSANIIRCKQAASNSPTLCSFGPVGSRSQRALAMAETSRFPSYSASKSTGRGTLEGWSR